jgi:hypothetical protein
MRRHITRTLYAAAAAVITLGTLGFAGADSPATAALRSLSPPGYSPSWAVVAEASVLSKISNPRQDFSVWLRHH